MRVLGIDPGGTTGFVVVDNFPAPDSDWTVVAQEYDFKAGIAALYNLFQFQAPDIVAIERYTISPRTLSRTRQTTALEVIGFVKGMGLIHGVDVLVQSPADAKLMWTDERLKSVGLWIPGKVHARDALRHALACLQRLGSVPPTVTV